MQPRRERDGELGGQPIRQVFFRLGEVIVEVVGSPTTAAEGPSSLWGITYVVADIDGTVAFFGDTPRRPRTRSSRAAGSPRCIIARSNVGPDGADLAARPPLTRVAPRAPTPQ